MNNKIVKMSRKFFIVAFILTMLIMVAPAAEVRAAATSPWFKSPATPVLSTGAGAAWDNGGVGTVSVIVDGGTYKMWYTGYDSTNGLLQIGYATSSDGKTWARGNGGLPVLTPTGIQEAEGIGSPRVVLDGGTYRMWYTGYKLVSGEFVPRIFYATSPNGITSWTRQNSGNPVLIPGAPSAFDERGVYSGAVIQDSGTNFKMWYTGRGGTGLLGTSKIGYATSSDAGLTWTKVGGTGGPVLSGDAATWNVDGVAVPSVVKTDATHYYMWFTGYAGITRGDIQVKIGLATSADGITGWSKTATPVVDKATSGWSAGGVGAPWVIDNGPAKSLEMWYSGLDTNLNSRVGYAATPDAVLTVTAKLQGDSRPDLAPPSDGYDVALTLKLYTVAVTTANITTVASDKVMTKAAGDILITIKDTVNKIITFTVSGVPSGVYNITLYSPQCLVNYKATVNIPAAGMNLDMGELREGDSIDITENSKTIDIDDFARFAAAYEGVEGPPASGNWNAKADFDADGYITILDFSLLYTNYGKTSPQAA